MRVGLLAVALVLVVPSIVAFHPPDQIWQADEEGSTLRWQILEKNHEGSVTSRTGTFNWVKHHTLDKAIDEGQLLIYLTATITNSEEQDGVWNYTVEMRNGGGNVDLGACYFHYRTFNAGVLGGDLITRTYFELPCAADVDVLENGTIQYWINRTVLSGTPSTPSQTHFTIAADRVDYVVYPMDLNIVNLETYLPILMFLGLLCWSLWNGWLLPALASLLGLISSYMDVSIGEIGAMFLFAVFLFLQYYRNQPGFLGERGLRD